MRFFFYIYVKYFSPSFLSLIPIKSGQTAFPLKPFGEEESFGENFPYAQIDVNLPLVYI